MLRWPVCERECLSRQPARVFRGGRASSLDRAQSTLRIRNRVPKGGSQKEIRESRVGATRGRSSRQAAAAAEAKGGDDAWRCAQVRHVRSEQTTGEGERVSGTKLSLVKESFLITDVAAMARDSMRVNVRMTMLAARRVGVRWERRRSVETAKVDEASTLGQNGE